MSIAEYKTTPGANTAISGINIAEGCPPSGINDAIRQMMADIATSTNAAGLLGMAVNLPNSTPLAGLTTGEACNRLDSAHPDNPFPGSTCLLWVKQVIASQCVHVAMTISSGLLAQRFYNNSAWGTWTRLDPRGWAASNAEVAAGTNTEKHITPAGLFSLGDGLFGQALTIADTTSLDSLTSGESYYRVLGTHPGNPFPGATCLVWTKQITSAQTVQIATAVSTGRQAQRFCNSGSWGAWAYTVDPSAMIKAGAHISSAGSAFAALNIASSSMVSTGVYTIQFTAPATTASYQLVAATNGQMTFFPWLLSNKTVNGFTMTTLNQTTGNPAATSWSFEARW